MLDNLVWHSSTSRAVDNLRQRVHFHQTKVNFIAKPFEYQLLISIDQQLRDLKVTVTEIRDVVVRGGIPNPDSGAASSTGGEYLALPEDIQSRLTERLSVDQPVSFESHEDFPLKEGFDAVIFHFEKSTVTFQPNIVSGQRGADPPQFLNLLKSRWILEKLTRSVNLQSAGPESLWAKYMSELKCEIQRQLDRFQSAELVAPEWSVISQLPDSCFSIWIDNEPSAHPASLTGGQPLEEKILELELEKEQPNRQSTLTVFRKSDVVFRLLLTNKDEKNNSFESVDVNMAHTRLIPTFAASEDSCSANHSLYLWPDHIQPRCYTMVDSKAVHDFQRALLGYRVSHEMTKVKWCIEYQTVHKRGMSGEARLQLWQLKPLSRKFLYSEQSPRENQDTSAVKYTGSPCESAQNQQRHGSYLSQRPCSAIESRVSGSCGDGIALLRPELPAIVMFTEYKKRYNLLHLRCTVRENTHSSHSANDL